MNRWRITLGRLVLCLLLGCCSWAQTSISVSGSADSDGFSFKATFSGEPPYATAPITGAPYSGERVSETRQTLADGTSITRDIPTEFVARDSQGRTRTEGPLGRVSPRLEIKLIRIDDPVAGYQYVLDTYNRVAHRLTLARFPVRALRTRVAPGAAVGGVIATPPGTADSPARTLVGARETVASTTPPPGPPTGADSTRPTSRGEKLGPQTMEGVTVEGTRSTTTYPAGAEGNDRPFTVISENWRCPELRIEMLSKTIDPRSGEGTTRLTNLSLAEPDPSLFQPPPDYAIVDEAGQFTIEVKAP
jgi:hypothetical protein